MGTVGPVLITGFDLDMTLIDSRPGIRAAYRALSAETGVWIDADLVVTRLGPPLETELANWVPPQDIEAFADRYRAIYPDVALPLIEPLPGALEALGVAAEAGPVLLVTGKAQANAELHAKRLGVRFDRIAGDVWRYAKADVLRAEGAGVYVGDHVSDMEAATAASVPGVGVATGPCSRQELADAGASVVLADLSAGFASWLAEHRAELQ